MNGSHEASTAELWTIINDAMQRSLRTVDSGPRISGPPVESGIELENGIEPQQNLLLRTVRPTLPIPNVYLRVPPQISRTPEDLIQWRAVMQNTGADG